MISFDDATDIKHRVIIYDTVVSDEAHEWCKTKLGIGDWTSEVFDNFDCFYFTSIEICSMFMLVHSGKYVEPHRGKNER